LKLKKQINQAFDEALEGVNESPIDPKAHSARPSAAMAA